LRLSAEGKREPNGIVDGRHTPPFIFTTHRILHRIIGVSVNNEEFDRRKARWVVGMSEKKHGKLVTKSDQKWEN